MMGMPSISMVNAMAFFWSERSEVSDGKRATSWFSRKDPRSVVSLHVDFMVLIPFTRLLMLPLVVWKACVIQ